MRKYKKCILSLSYWLCCFEFLGNVLMNTLTVTPADWTVESTQTVKALFEQQTLEEGSFGDAISIKTRLVIIHMILHFFI